MVPNIFEKFGIRHPRRTKEGQKCKGTKAQSKRLKVKVKNVKPQFKDKRWWGKPHPTFSEYFLIEVFVLGVEGGDGDVDYFHFSDGAVSAAGLD
jgi:hypothetical protein